jgi:hypothetical protein
MLLKREVTNITELISRSRVLTKILLSQLSRNLLYFTNMIVNCRVENESALKTTRAS